METDGWEPPPIPNAEEAPPIPPGNRAYSTEEAPPIPDRGDAPPPIPKQPVIMVPVVLEKSRSPNVIHAQNSREVLFVTSSGPLHQQQPVIVTGHRSEIVRERAFDEGQQTLVIATAGGGPQRPVLARFALAMSLLCIPLSLGALFLPFFWIPVFICALLARAFGGYARRQGGPSENLGILAVQLGRGFFFIAIIGVVFLLAVITLWGLSIANEAVKSWQSSNVVAHWFVGQVDGAEAFVKGIFVHPSQAPSPAPTPASSP
jgi:hypothetical protein